MALLDLVGRRWTLRVMWELHTSHPQPLTFRALQERCGALSSSVLNRRLHDLREARLVAAGPGGYALTPIGSDLVVLLAPLDTWAHRWGTDLGTAGRGEVVTDVPDKAPGSP